MSNRENDKTKETGAWVSARYVQYFLSMGEVVGLPMREMLAASGLPDARQLDAESRVPVSQLEVLLDNLSTHHATPLVGLQLAGQVQPATFGVLGFLTQACATFADILDMLVRYNGLLSNIGHTSVHHHPGRAHLQWDCRAVGPLFKRHATEYVLGSFTVLARALLQEKKDALMEVNFAHPAPENPSLLLHYHALFRCPVYFDKPISELVISSSLLSTRLLHSDALVREALERHAEELLRKRQRLHLAEDVRGLISAMLGTQAVNRETVARQLGMSGRSLHRLLEQEGTGFQQLMDEVRLERAKVLLGSGMTTEDAGLKTGFQSRQAFIRWFKAETGKTPGAFQ